MPYKLRQSIEYQSSEIRSVYVINNEEFYLARDKTLVQWKENEGMYVEMKTSIEHRHYVSTCACISPSGSYPNGLIITGCLDNTLNVFDPQLEQPICILNGHQNCISAIQQISEDVVASGSWDSTIKIWSLKEMKCTQTVQDHQATVHSIIIIQDMLISASADKTINIYWKMGIYFREKLFGHTDRVRDLAPLKDYHFLSCSNDGTVRRWNALTGINVGTVFSQKLILCSIAAFDDASLIVCGSEENSLLILNMKDGDELLKIPSINVSSVGVFPDGDIITGSSDGCLRIFSDKENRQTKPNELAEYEEEVKLNTPLPDNTNSSFKRYIYGLPDAEVLANPGKSDGEITLTHENDKILCYVWSQDLISWELFGHVTCDIRNAGSLVPAKFKKISYEGKKYDFVFKIQETEGSVLLDLPYKIRSNPYTVAIEFLKAHKLPPIHLKTIVNFLLQYTEDEQYVLPIPQNEKHPLFDQENVISFNSGNPQQIKDKLVEMVKEVDGHNKFEKDKRTINKLTKMIYENINPDLKCLVRLLICFKWPEDKVYPALDILRLVIRHEKPNTVLCNPKAFNLMKIMKQYTNATARPVNSLLAIYILANMVLQEAGQELAFNKKLIILDIIESLIDKYRKNIQLETNFGTALGTALATLILNMSVILVKRCNVLTLKKYLNIAIIALKICKSKEAIFRLITGIGIDIGRIKKVEVDEKVLEILEELSNISGTDEIMLEISQRANKIMDYLQGLIS